VRTGRGKRYCASPSSSCRRAAENDSSTLLRFGLASLRRMSRIRLTPKASRTAYLSRFEQPEKSAIKGVVKGVIAKRRSGVVAISVKQGNKAMVKEYYVYIMTNKTNSVLYTGVTNDLVRRVYEHRNKLVDGFTKKYNVDKVVFYEVCEDINSAIAREKQIKGGSRAKKIKLIEDMNINWHDLYERL
jgi:putative endonuclease